MLKFIAGVIVGIVVSQVGFSGMATYLDKGVAYVKEASKQADAKIEEKVDRP